MDKSIGPHDVFLWLGTEATWCVFVLSGQKHWSIWCIFVLNGQKHWFTWCVFVLSGQKHWFTWCVFVLNGQKYWSTWCVFVLNGQKHWSTWRVFVLIGQKHWSTWCVFVLNGQKPWSTWCVFVLNGQKHWSTWCLSLGCLDKVVHGEAPIQCLTRSRDPISCSKKPMERTNEIGLEIISSVRSTAFPQRQIGSYDKVRKWIGDFTVKKWHEKRYPFRCASGEFLSRSYHLVVTSKHTHRHTHLTAKD